MKAFTRLRIRYRRRVIAVAFRDAGDMGQEWGTLIIGGLKPDMITFVRLLQRTLEIQMGACN